MGTANDGLSKSDVNQGLQGRTVALSVLAFLALVMFLRYAQELFIPVVLSLLIAYALNPFVSFLERFRIQRMVAAAIIVVALFGGIGIGGYALRQQLSAVLDSMPGAIAKVGAQLRKLRQSGADSRTSIGKIRQTANEIEKAAAVATGTAESTTAAKAKVEEPAFRVTDFIRIGSLGMLGFVSNAVLVMFLVFFLLVSGDLFKRKLVHLIGTGLSNKKLTVQTLNEINSQIERFLLIQFLTSVAVGCCIGLGLWMFGLHQPVLWGVAAGLVCSIPYVGPIFVGVASMAAAFVQFDSIAAAGELGLIPLIIFSLEGLLIKPAVMGKAARINSVAMFLSLLFWSWIWGLIGIIVAVPLMMIIKTVCDRVEALQPIATLLDES